MVGYSFGRFLTRKRSILLELLIIGSVSLSPEEILGSSCQGFVEREDGVMEVLVCCGGGEKNGERGNMIRNSLGQAIASLSELVHLLYIFFGYF